MMIVVAMITKHWAFGDLYVVLFVLYVKKEMQRMILDKFGKNQND